MSNAVLCCNHAKSKAISDGGAENCFIHNGLYVAIIYTGTPLAGYRSGEYWGIDIAAWAILGFVVGGFLK